MRKDGSFVKIERISQIRKQIGKLMPKPVPIDSLCTWVEVNIGLTRENAEKYIELAVKSSDWVILDGKIVSEATEV